jgi:nitroreductase
MQLLSFSEIAISQRACRRFDGDEDMPDDDVLKILDMAVHAPSAHNWQPWEFIVVRDSAARTKICDMTRSLFAEGKERMQTRVSEGHFRSAVDGMEKHGLDSAPVIIVVCANLERIPRNAAPASIFPAVQNILLGAASLNYGSCMATGLAELMSEWLGELLSLPETILPLACVYLGKPTRRLGAPSREPARVHTHRERFGLPW